MSLMETDAQNIDRSSPTFDAPDLVDNRMAHGTSSPTLLNPDTVKAFKLRTRDGASVLTDSDIEVLRYGSKTDGSLGMFLSQNGAEVLRVGSDNAGNFGLTIGDGNVSELFAGQDAGGNRVVKIAKAGVDVHTASNDQLVFNSGQDIFKIVQSGTTSMNFLGSGPQSVTLAHKLDYIPIVLSYFQVSSLSPLAGAYIPMPYSMTQASIDTTVPFAVAIAAANSTNIIFQYSDIYGAATINFRYYILQETAN